jgi:uncharacterized membrane protein
MTKKSYSISRITIAIVLALICSISIEIQNYIIPAVAVITAMIVLMGMRKRVDTILADEMDYHIAGKAARYAINIYCVITAMLSLYFIAERAKDPVYELLSSIFSYSTCAVLGMNSLIFILLKNKKYARTENENKD